MAELLKGAPAAAARNEKTAQCIHALRQRGVVPTLALVRVGEDEADIAYERSACRRCQQLGAQTRQYALPRDVSQAQLVGLLEQLGADHGVHGILLFRPLPRTLDDRTVCAAVAPEKDLDGITDGSAATIYTGSGQGFAPCTAEAAVALLDHYGIDVRGRRVVIVGRSLVIGRPAALLLLQRDATVTICHSKTKALAEETRRADVLLVAAGQAGLIGQDHLRPGQIVLDMGIHAAPDGSLIGDVDFQAAEPLVQAITPVPGGVGALTTAILAEHLAQAAARAARYSI